MSSARTARAVGLGRLSVTPASAATASTTTRNPTKNPARTPPPDCENSSSRSSGFSRTSIDRGPALAGPGWEPRKSLRVQVNPDALDLGVVLERVGTHLAAEPALLVAAE